ERQTPAPARPAPSSLTLPARARLLAVEPPVDAPQQPAGHRVQAARAVDRSEPVLGHVVGHERLGLLGVQLEPALDGGLGVVVPLDDLTTARVAFPVVFG